MPGISKNSLDRDLSTIASAPWGLGAEAKRSILRKYKGTRYDAVIRGALYERKQRGRAAGVLRPAKRKSRSRTSAQRPRRPRSGAFAGVKPKPLKI